MGQPQEKPANYNAATEPAPLRLVVPAECAGMRLDQALARLLPQHSRSRLQDWVRERRVLLEGAGAETRTRVWGGERLEVSPQAELQALANEAQPIPLEIVYEDEALLVVAKPAGLVVHPGSGNWSGTLLNALLHHAPQLAGLPRAGIVHRLDKDTTGLLVVAKTAQAQTDLVRQLQARTVSRLYLALVAGDVERSGAVDAPVGRHPTQRTKMAVVEGGRSARTHFRVLERYGKATLLECALETGRTHQIRVHMAHLAHPLVGDPVYAGRRQAAGIVFPRQALHAWRLKLRHPASGEELEWQAPLPPDMQALLDMLRKEAAR